MAAKISKKNGPTKHQSDFFETSSYISASASIGPKPQHDVVVMAVRKAVRAATNIFTAISMIRFFMA